jgi:hypothetical protein
MNIKTLRNISWLVLFFAILFYFYSTNNSEKQSQKPTETTPVDLKEVVDWARSNLSQTGTLQEGKDGFVYLKVDDNYIHQLFPLLHRKNYEEPPYFRRIDSPGAHISVFYTDERNRIGRINEIGQPFTFTINHIKTVPPGSNEYLVLTVTSPELERLRKKYGLKPLLRGHDFHITIAKKKEHYR